MKLPQELITVTPFSRIFALVLVVILPIIGFFIGIRYQQTINALDNLLTDNTNLLIKRVPTPTPSQTIDTSNWKMYNNVQYGFSFQYPSDWQIHEKINYIAVENPSKEILSIAYKRKGEGVNIIRSGVGAGDIVARKTIQFGDQILNKNVLMFQGKDKSVLYNNAAEVPIANLVFSLSVDNFSTYDLSLDQQTEDQADQIVQTFTFTQ